MRLFLMTFLGFLTFSAFAESSEKEIARSVHGYQLILKSNTVDGKTFDRAYSVQKPGSMYRRPIRVGFSSMEAAEGEKTNENLDRLHLLTHASNRNFFQGFLIDDFEQKRSFRILEQNGGLRLTCSLVGFSATKLVAENSVVDLLYDRSSSQASPLEKQNFITFGVVGGQLFGRVDLDHKFVSIRNVETRALVFEGSCK